MAGRTQKIIGPDEPTIVPHHVFADECSRMMLIQHPEPAPEEGKERSGLMHYGGNERKVTIFSEFEGERDFMEVVLERVTIEASMTISPRILSLMDAYDRRALENLMRDPDDHVTRVSIKGPDNCYLFAHRFGNGHPPFFTCRVGTVLHFRRLLSWLFGLPMDAEFPQEDTLDMRD